MNLIVVDIGNTSTAVALAAGRKITHIRRITTATTTVSQVEGILRALVRKREICGTVVSSVVPAVTPLWQRTVKKVLEHPPLLVSHRLNFGLRIDYPRPETIGSDRLANVCGAVMRRGPPVVVVDFGTATTFDVVTSDGRFVGGVICPGPLLMTEYLAERTALLPKIRMTGRYGRVGRSTAEAVRIGARVGYRGLVQAVLDHVRQYPGTEGARLFATGGFARWGVAGIDEPFVVAPDLTLYGLACIHDLNGGR